MAGIRKRDPEVMRQISSFVEEYFFEYHQSPSMQKIATAIGISKSTAYYYVNEMAEKGMLDYDGKNIETRSMQKSDYKMNRAPVLGGIACGSPELTEEDFEEFIALPVALFGEGDFFVLRTHGDSMIEVGIEDGDKVVVRPQQTADNGQIVVARIGDEATVKRLSRKNGQVWLLPENPAFDPIDGTEAELVGVVKAVVREY